MPESLDHKISNRIKSAFENYDEPFNEKAWELMKDKLADKKKKRFVLFIDIAKAASVLLIIGLAALLPYQSKVHYAFQIQNINKNENIDAHKFLNKENFLTENGTDKTIKNDVLNNKNDYSNNITENNIEDYTVIEIIDTLNQDNKNRKDIYADNVFENYVDTFSNITQNDSDEIIDKRPILRPDDDDFFFEKKSDKKFKFALAVSSHYTSSDIGAKDNINIGGGFLTGYMLSKNISINSGILIANHDMNTQSGSLLGGFMKSDAVENSLYDNAYVGNTEKEVQLVGLDIPLNIQFNFDQFFVSTGFSSLVYLRERYSENFYVENSSQVFNSETNDYETVYMYDNVNNTLSEGAFHTFDFAKLINLSFGYKIPLKKGSLIFEPYAKIPTGSLTSYNISFGYGGLSFKYHF